MQLDRMEVRYANANISGKYSGEYSSYPAKSNEF